MKKTFLISIAVGVLIWITFPLISGLRIDSTTSGWYYYMITLSLSGLIFALIAPRKFWLWPIGILIGQLIAFPIAEIIYPMEDGYFIFSLTGIIVLTSFFILFYTAIFNFGGALVGKAIRYFIKKSKK
jgi:hypothetical protein